MKAITKAVTYAMYMAVVYHALSSHDEKPVMVSRPAADREEAEELADTLKRNLDPDRFTVVVRGIRGGHGLEAVFASLEQLKGSSQVEPEQPHAIPAQRSIEPD